MVLLKHRLPLQKFPGGYFFTFHYGSSQTNFTSTDCQFFHLLYIPLWFFSNDMYGSTLPSVKIFTFHYGSSQTMDNWFSISFPILFTFHYGSSQTFCHMSPCFSSSSFTFHYGSSQTYCTLDSFFDEKIYIPLWFFSNEL